MRFRLHHPLWTHLPAVLPLAATAVALLWHDLPLPRPAPLHFALQGPGVYLRSTRDLDLLLMGAFYIVLLSVVFDEAWSRQEVRKRFNSLSLLDEFGVALIVGGVWGYVLEVWHGPGNLLYSVGVPAVVLAGMVGMGALVELMRPCRPAEGPALASEDSEAVQAEIAERTARQQRWVHWETQNPAWVSVLGLLGVVVSWYTAVYFVGQWAATHVAGFLPAVIECCILAVVYPLLVLYGFGMRVVVTPEQILVRLGMLGRRARTLETADVVEAEVHAFSPLPDFRSFFQIGVRWRGMRAYFFGGRRGVRLRTANGEQYLIGSEHPERLATVINAARGLRRSPEGSSQAGGGAGGPTTDRGPNKMLPASRAFGARDA